MNMPIGLFAVLLVFHYYCPTNVIKVSI